MLLANDITMEDENNSYVMNIQQIEKIFLSNKMKNSFSQIAFYFLKRRKLLDYLYQINMQCQSINSKSQLARCFKALTAVDYSTIIWILNRTACVSA